MTQQELAAQFRALHVTDRSQILILPNAWDPMSARVVEAAGAKAIATTSAGVSWAMGRPDGQGLSRDDMAGAVQRMVQSVRIPVTADMERGYGNGTPEDVAQTVRAVVNAGAVGVNFEDSPGADGALLSDASLQSERFAAAREAARASGVDVFINARIDTYVKKFGNDTERFDETVRRAHLYVAAGADGVFVPLATEPDVIRRLAEAVGAPLNVIGGPGTPTIPELQALGVARVSVGPGLARSILAHIRSATQELLGTGTYNSIHEQIPSPEANALFAGR